MSVTSNKSHESKVKLEDETKEAKVKGNLSEMSKESIGSLRAVDKSDRLNEAQMSSQI